MELSLRLKAIAGEVDKGSVIADIGTDHGYIPLYLLKNGIAQAAIASDINKGPLLIAKKNILKEREEKIELRLGPGLATIAPYEVDEAIIAGMGGMLIIDILKESLGTAKTFKKLILQPQLDVPEVRKYIHEIGLKIQNEKMVKEEGKFYNIISAVKGTEKYNDTEYLYGKILIMRKDAVLKEYIEDLTPKNNKIMKKLREENTDNANKKLLEIEKQMKINEEVLECL